MLHPLTNETRFPSGIRYLALAVVGAIVVTATALATGEPPGPAWSRNDFPGVLAWVYERANAVTLVALAACAGLYALLWRPRDVPGAIALSSFFPLYLAFVQVVSGPGSLGPLELLGAAGLVLASLAGYFLGRCAAAVLRRHRHKES